MSDRPSETTEGLVEAIVGYVSGAATRSFADAAAVALLLASLGFAPPASVFDLLDSLLAFYRGNELLFLPGFLFASVPRTPRLVQV